MFYSDEGIFIGGASMNQNGMIGAHIRSLRLARKYTLKQLSDESGLSVGFLSQLERGISSVAIDTLGKLAEILGTDLSSFFSVVNVARTEPVLHSFELRSNPVSAQIVQYVLSNDPASYQLLPRLFTLLPLEDVAEEIEMYSHEGEEFAYVLEGIVTVYLDGKRYTLYPGDSIQIRSNAQHNWFNETNKVAKLLTVNSPNPLRAVEAEEERAEDGAD